MCAPFVSLFVLLAISRVFEQRLMNSKRERMKSKNKKWQKATIFARCALFFLHSRSVHFIICTVMAFTKWNLLCYHLPAAIKNHFIFTNSLLLHWQQELLKFWTLSILVRNKFPERQSAQTVSFSLEFFLRIKLFNVCRNFHLITWKKCARSINSVQLRNKNKWRNTKHERFGDSFLFYSFVVGVCFVNTRCSDANKYLNLSLPLLFTRRFSVFFSYQTFVCFA